MKEQVSPIEQLLLRFPRTFADLAPERREDFERHKGVVQRVRIACGARYEAETGFGLVRLSLESLERLWAVCYGYLKVWSTLQSRGWKPGERVELKDNPDYDQARALLNWATIDHHAFAEAAASEFPQESRPPWPRNCPDPTQENDSDVRGANNLFRYVLGAIILHEIGHLENDDTVVESSAAKVDEATSEEAEFRADDYMGSFLLDRWREDQR